MAKVCQANANEDNHGGSPSSTPEKSALARLCYAPAKIIFTICIKKIRANFQRSINERVGDAIGVADTPKIQ